MALAVGETNGPANSDSPPLKLNAPNEGAFTRRGKKALRAAPSNETVNGPAFTLEAATISMGGGMLDDRSIAVIGQGLVGTLSSPEFTIEVGTVPCPARTLCAEDCHCDYGDACTNAECNSGVCPNPNPQRLYGDIDGDIDLFDLFGVLNAFSGTNACNCPLGP